MRKDVFGIQSSLIETACEVQDLTDKVIVLVMDIQKHTNLDSPIRESIAFEWLEEYTNKYVSEKITRYGSYKNPYNNKA